MISQRPGLVTERHGTVPLYNLTGNGGTPVDYPVRIDTDIAIIVPSGRLTIGEPAEALGRAIEQAFRSGAHHLLFDCSAVPYADSSGIGELLAGMRRAREVGGKAAIIGARGKIHEILDLTQLSRLFVIEETEQEALAKLKG
jgi:anti-anti-sigma factor